MSGELGKHIPRPRYNNARLKQSRDAWVEDNAEALRSYYASLCTWIGGEQSEEGFANVCDVQYELEAIRG